MFGEALEGTDRSSALLVEACAARCRTLKLIRAMPTELESLNQSANLKKLVLYQTPITRPGYGFEGPLVLPALKEMSMAVSEYIVGRAHVTLFLLTPVVPNLQALAYTDPAQTSVTPETTIYDLIDRSLIAKLRYFSMPFDANVIQDTVAFDASLTLVDFWMHAEPKEGAHLVERELSKVLHLRISTTEAQRKQGIERDWPWIDSTVSRCASNVRAIVLPLSLAAAGEADKRLPLICALEAKGVAILFDDVDENDVAASGVSHAFWKWRRPMSYAASLLQ